MTLGVLYEFPSTSVRVTLDKTRAAYSPGKIEALLAEIPEGQRTAMKKLYAETKLKTYKVEVGGPTIETNSYFVDDNYLFQPYDVTKGKNSTAVVMQHQSNPQGLVVTVSSEQ